MRLDLTRQVLRQRMARGLFRFLRGQIFEGQRRRELFFGAGCLQFLKLQFQLRDLADELFALRSEEHPLQLVEQQLQVSDLACTRGKLFMLRAYQSLYGLDIEIIPINKQGCGHRRSMPRSSHRHRQKTP